MQEHVSGLENCFLCSWLPEDGAALPCLPQQGDPLVSYLLKADDCSSIAWASSSGELERCEPGRWQQVNSSYTVNWPDETCYGYKAAAAERAAAQAASDATVTSITKPRTSTEFYPGPVPKGVSRSS